MLETFRRMEETRNFKKNGGCLKLLEEWKQLETSKRMEAT